MKHKLKGVYLVTNTSIQHQYNHAQLAEMALRGGANIVQFRDNQSGARESLKYAKSVVNVCRSYNAMSIINDRTDIAIAAEATGVHLGQDDLPLQTAREILNDGQIIGGTSSTLKEARQVEAEGADYVALGHIFDTTTKQKDYAPRGLDILQKVSKSLSIPVVAIGGITLENASDVIAAGADMIAVSSAICCAPNPVKATEKLMNLFD
ncbi:MAG TPA: thiamine phosphate synthase [Balneolaceae bacterium]|nr:thiamine phosphate synthase [Balneolaceae bacterium]